MIDYQQRKSEEGEDGKKRMKIVKTVPQKADFVTTSEEDVKEFRKHVGRVRQQCARTQIILDNDF